MLLLTRVSDKESDCMVKMSNVQKKILYLLHSSTVHTTKVHIERYAYKLLAKCVTKMEKVEGIYNKTDQIIGVFYILVGQKAQLQEDPRRQDDVPSCCR